MPQRPQLIEHLPLAAITLIPREHHPGGADASCYGALSCHWCLPYRPGRLVDVSIMLLRQRVTAGARVAQCRLEEEGYRLVLQLIDPQQAFAVRMMEQLCRIRHYQLEISRHEGRQLNTEQAALEWISRFAGDFPTG